MFKCGLSGSNENVLPHLYNVECFKILFILTCLMLNYNCRLSKCFSENEFSFFSLMKDLNCFYRETTSDLYKIEAYRSCLEGTMEILLNCGHVGWLM